MPLLSPDRRARGATISALRQARGVRQGDLATAVGLSPGHLSHIESGRHTATVETTAALAAALDVPVDVLTGQVPPLRPLRRILDITAQAVADAAGTTVARLDRIERGTERAHPDELAAIAVRLGVRPAALGADADTAAAS